jgi:hypothetical protein
MDVVQTHGGNNWGAIVALVPGRTKSQCIGRWKGVLDPSIDRANGSTGKWSVDKDVKLKDAVQTHGGKNWGPIAALVPGRTITTRVSVTKDKIMSWIPASTRRVDIRVNV